MLSLHSMERSQHPERIDSDNEALTSDGEVNLHSPHIGKAKSSHVVTQKTGNSREHGDTPPMPADWIMMQSNVSSKEQQRLGDLPANTAT